MFCGGVGGSKRKRPNDVVGEKIDMFVAPNIALFMETTANPRFNLETGLTLLYPGAKMPPTQTFGHKIERKKRKLVHP